MRNAIKTLIQNAKHCENWSLGYHRLATWEDHKAKLNDTKVLLGSNVPEVYPGAFKSWQSAVDALPGVQIVKATTASPLAFGLGDKNVYETGLTLSHTYGVPMLPGSSVKGAMRRAAADLLGVRDALAKQYSPEVALSDLLKKIPESEQEKVKQWATLFGSTEGMAAVTVHDAWFNPVGAGLQPLMKDVVTVHHPNYYQKTGKDKQPPSDMDDPNPIEFWSVKPGVEFWFPIEGPDGWREAAVEILKVVLKHYGLGAKTNAGYGLFKLDGPTPVGGSASADEPGEEVTVIFDRYSNQDAMVKEGGSKDLKLCTGCPPKLQRGQALKAIRRGRGFIFRSLA